MVAPFAAAAQIAGASTLGGALAPAAGAAGGGLLTQLLGGVGGNLLQGLGGSLLGGLGGSLFGGGRTGALEKLLEAVSANQRNAVRNFESNFPRFREAFRSNSPAFAALEDRVLGDLNDEQRTSRLESAFQRRLQQQQASLGLLRSPTSALRTSFAGLQFNEDMRQRAFDNAMGFQGGLAQPLATGFFQSGLANISPDTGFNQVALRLGQNQMMRQSVVGGFNEGFQRGERDRALTLAERLAAIAEE